MGPRCEEQRVHQSGSVRDLARVIERMLHIGERGFGIAEHPQSQWSMSQHRHRDVCAKSRSQRTMLVRIVKRDCPIEMRPALDDVARIH